MPGNKISSSSGNRADGVAAPIRNQRNVPMQDSSGECDALHKIKRNFAPADSMCAFPYIPLYPGVLISSP
jgi:hypothetical protein